MKIHTIICVAILAAIGSITAQAQTMDEIIKQMSEDAKKGQATGTYNNYSNDLLGQPQSQNLLGQPLSNQLLTPEQAQQHTTNNLLRALSGELNRPEGETNYERNQRRLNLSNQMSEENAIISQRQNEYNQARNRRLYGGDDQNYSSDQAAPSSEYARKRAERLNRGNVSTSTPTNPNAKPAGFGAGYAGGYKDSPPSTATPNDQPLTGITTNSARARRGNLRDLEAGVVIDVKDDPPTNTPTPPPPRTCFCLGSDPYNYGVCAIGSDNSDSYGAGVASVNRPWTSDCHPSADSRRNSRP